MDTKELINSIMEMIKAHRQYQGRGQCEPPHGSRGAKGTKAKQEQSQNQGQNQTQRGFAN